MMASGLPVDLSVVDFGPCSELDAHRFTLTIVIAWIEQRNACR